MSKFLTSKAKVLLLITFALFESACSDPLKGVAASYLKSTQSQTQLASTGSSPAPQGSPPPPLQTFYPPTTVVASKPNILVTGYQVQQGHTRNNSWDIAKLIQSFATTYGISANVYLCLLPVAYTQASTVALDCYRQMPRAPVAVFSLGEFDYSNLWLVTVATNSDNSGLPLIPGAPNRIGFNFPVQAMYCQAQNIGTSMPILLDDGVTVGTFVCNDTNYRLSTYFTGIGIPYTFFHVPISPVDGGQYSAAGVSPVVGSLISVGLNFNIQQIAPNYPLPWGSNGITLPTSSLEVAMLASQSSGLSPCEQNFLNNKQELSGYVNGSATKIDTQSGLAQVYSYFNSLYKLSN